MKKESKIETVIMDPNGNEIYRSISDDISNVEEAVNQAVTNAGLTIPAEDCVFYVTDFSDHITHTYRINADGNLTEIV